MTSSFSAVDYAILAAVKAFAWDIPLAAVGYEGVAFTPPDNQPWAYVTLMPVATDSTLQTVDKDRQLLQIDLSGPMNQGTADLYQRRDALMAYFLPRKLFTFNGQNVRVKNRSRSNWRTYGGWEVISVSVTFEAVIDRGAGFA
jgi:hypothetical protein